MRPMRWAQRGALLFGMGSAVVCLLSCGAPSMGSRRVLRADGAPVPNSFCVLNPEGCPPPRSSASAQSEPFDLSACLKACEAGGALLESYCRGLPEDWQRRLCWSVVEESKEACRNMCYALNACATSADCPERDE
jgi:hypothetical protein